MDAQRAEIAEFATRIIGDVIHIDVGTGIDPATKVGPEGLGIESITMMELVTQIEREYDIAIPDESIDVMLSDSFDTLVDEVQKHRV